MICEADAGIFTEAKRASAAMVMGASTHSVLAGTGEAVGCTVRAESKVSGLACKTPLDKAIVDATAKRRGTFRCIIRK
jgi:hypothetical protein